MTASPRIPDPDGLNAEFYEAVRHGVLHLQRCSACQLYRHPPRYLCERCGSDLYEWVPSPGAGLLFSWTVTHIAFDRGWQSEIPYTTGVVELDEGVRIVGSVPDLDSTELRIGLPMVAHLDPLSDTFAFVSFRPADT